MSYNAINKDNINFLLNEVAKEYKKEYGRHSNIEIVLVGGAAVLAKYNFRYASGDIDMTSTAASVIKEVANRVGDRLNLPNGWLNNDFVKTDSFSHKIYEHSKYYKEFAQVLTVRVVSDEFLIAMKLKAGRSYKNDISDIVGILAENQTNGKPISFERIDNAMQELYGGWDGISNDLISFVQNATQSDSLDQLYNDVAAKEIYNRDTVLKFADTEEKSQIKEFIEEISKQMIEEINFDNTDFDDSDVELSYEDLELSDDDWEDSVD